MPCLPCRPFGIDLRGRRRLSFGCTSFAPSVRPQIDLTQMGWPTRVSWVALSTGGDLLVLPRWRQRSGGREDHVAFTVCPLWSGAVHALFRLGETNGARPRVFQTSAWADGQRSGRPRCNRYSGDPLISGGLCSQPALLEIWILQISGLPAHSGTCAKGRALGSVGSRTCWRSWNRRWEAPAFDGALGSSMRHLVFCR